MKVLYEGINELNVALTPIVLVANLYVTVMVSGTGARLAGVKVTIDGLTAITSATGGCAFMGITPGSYTITCEKVGYETVTLHRRLSGGNNSVAATMHAL